MSGIKGVITRGLKALGKKFGFPRLTKEEIETYSKAKPRHPNGTNCYFEFGKNDLRRSLYTFFKFFDLAGVNIRIKHDNLLFAEMKSDQYGKWVLEEKLFQLVGEPSNSTKKYSLSDKSGSVRISDDYFNFSNKEYFIPLTMHPGMYRNGFWNAQVESKLRIHSIFLAGNFNPSTYRRIKSDQLFDVIIRTELLQKLKDLELVNELGSFEALVDDGLDKVVTVVDTRTFTIPMGELRKFLGRYTFFLAAPGASVPLSHNLVEAMSVGCIPIIQKGYADYIYPALTHKSNALIFENEEDLESIINEALSMDYGYAQSMIRAVNHYYEENMTPQKVVEKLMSPKLNGARLLSFSSSINHLK